MWLGAWNRHVDTWQTHMQTCQQTQMQAVGMETGSLIGSAWKPVPLKVCHQRGWCVLCSVFSSFAMLRPKYLQSNYCKIITHVQVEVFLLSDLVAGRLPNTAHQLWSYILHGSHSFLTRIRMSYPRPSLQKGNYDSFLLDTCCRCQYFAALTTIVRAKLA